MSAPETNIEKQTRRHRGPLYGMAFVLAFAAVIFAAFLAWTSYQSDPATPNDPAAVVGN